MKGIGITKEDTQSILLVINDFSDELQIAIRRYLCEICYGKEESHAVRKKGDYQKTLRVFWERYDKKYSTQKMGMIAELLAHVLIILFFPDYETISVFFNKEEKSMRKGFDLIYLNNESKTILYGEVKSGQLKANQCPNEKNEALLDEAFNDIKKKFSIKEDTAWDSALVDVNLTVPNENRKFLRTLLEDDAPSSRTKTEKLKGDAILTSVVYGPLDKLITYSNLQAKFASYLLKGVINDGLVLSIQKQTFQKVEEFLKTEMES